MRKKGIRSRGVSVERLKEALGDKEFFDAVVYYQTKPGTDPEKKQRLLEWSNIVNVSIQTIQRDFRQWIADNEANSTQVFQPDMPSYSDRIIELEGKKWVAYGCGHIPYNEKGNTQKFYSIVKKVKPDVLIDCGDTDDSPLFDQHEKVRQMISTLSPLEDSRLIKQHYRKLAGWCGQAVALNSNHGDKKTRLTGGLLQWDALLDDSIIGDKWTFSQDYYCWVDHPANENGITQTKFEHARRYNKNPLQLGRTLELGDRGRNTDPNNIRRWDWVYAHTHQFSMGYSFDGWGRLISLGTFLKKDWVEYLMRNTTGYPYPTFGFVWFDGKKLHAEW